MKRFNLIISLLLCALAVSANVINMGSTTAIVDTMESYRVGPGTTYSHLKMTKGTKIRHMYLLDIDMTNPNVNLELVQGKHQLGSTEKMADMYNRLDAPNHRMVAGVNCSFWCVSATVTADKNSWEGLLGQPLNGSASGGVMITEVSNWNRGRVEANPAYDNGYIVVENNKHVIVNDLSWGGVVRLKDNQEYPIMDVNRPREWTDQHRITLYNHYMGAKGTANKPCKEVVFTVDKWRMNGDITCTVTSTNNVGGTVLAEGEGALQGYKDGETFLSALQVGDVFTVNIGVAIRDGSGHPDVKEMVGGNALVMHNGELTVRNYDDYNGKDYPRCLMATNAAGNRVWLLECAPTGGMTTEEGCYILGTMGATDISSYDGGGSAQMNVFGENMFKTTESTPRAIANALWVVASCDDSEDAGDLEFVDVPESLPAYASYTPQVRAFTKDGLFISHDYKKHKLHCEPSTMGTISEDGLTFTANPVTESGLLVATYGTARTETRISIKNGQIDIKYDSIMVGCDGYPVEVLAIAEDLILPLDESKLTWTTDKEGVISINNGVVSGLENGEVILYGVLDNFKDSIHVTVEVPQQDKVSVNNHWETYTMPLDTTFSVSNTRNASISIPFNTYLYGCPDSVFVDFVCACPLSAVEVTATPKVGEEENYKVARQLAANEAGSFHFSFDQLYGDKQQAWYPICLKELKFFLKDPKKNTPYLLTIKDIVLHYPCWKEASGLLDASKEDMTIQQKVMIDGQVYIIKGGEIYQLSGQKVR